MSVQTPEWMATAADQVRGTMQPIYLPVGLRVAAILVGLVIMLPPLLHTAAHAYLMVAGGGADHAAGSDWPRVVQIIVGAGVGFPDPVVRVVRALRHGKNGEDRPKGGDA